MAEKKYAGENVLTQLITLIKSNFVAKVTGKGLSENDLTGTLKTQYDAAYAYSQETHAPVDAEKNVFSSIVVNGTAATPDANRAVSLTIPTNNNQLTNGAGYQTSAEVESAINEALADISGISFSVASTLPTTGAAGTIYLVPNGTTGQNYYDEYIYYNNAWESIGSTDVDLSDYLQESELVEFTNAEILALWNSVTS